jgi:antirestriction protein ArdC
MSPHEQNGGKPPAKRDHRQEVTDSIVRMLEDGVAPWQKPWESAGMPFNPTTDKAYRGGNAVHLMATGLAQGYEDPRWMTYKQAAENGWQVRKGEKGTHIEFWEVKSKSEEKSGEREGNGNDGDAKDNQRRLIHRVYTVFNAKQIEGVPAFEREQPSAFEAVHSGERILANSGAKITHDQRDSAFYRASTDSIHLPPKEAFKDAPGYYGTALHEHAHWTGHASRLNRPTLNESYRFGDLNYAKEELRAELASVFIAAEVGVPHDPANHAA